MYLLHTQKLLPSKAAKVQLLFHRPWQPLYLLINAPNFGNQSPEHIHWVYIWL